MRLRRTLAYGIVWGTRTVLTVGLTLFLGFVCYRITVEGAWLQVLGGSTVSVAVMALAVGVYSWAEDTVKQLGKNP